MKKHSAFNALGSYAPPPNIVPQPPPVRRNALLGTCMYGVRPELPVRGFPPGRIRIRQRNTEFPRAFVKTANGIRHFIIAELDGHWVPYMEQGANHTPNHTGQPLPRLGGGSVAPGCSTPNG